MKSNIQEYIDKYEDLEEDEFHERVKYKRVKSQKQSLLDEMRRNDRKKEKHRKKEDEYEDRIL